MSNSNKNSNLESKIMPVVSRKILFQMTGSIAAFKACALLSKLKQQGHDVQVVASRSALQFVGAATLEGLSGQAVISDLWEQGRAMDHIHAVRWADAIVVAPASAHFINRIAQGVGDDLLTTMFLAHDFKKPFLIAPAMNTSMYLHPATQRSIKILKDWGVEILESASGVLACGEQGYGRLLEPEQLLQEISARLSSLSRADAATPALSTTGASAEPDKGRKSAGASLASRGHSIPALRVLVTAGGTLEPIDDVRFIANESTGQTGVEIARALHEMGVEVTLLAAERSAPSGSLPQRRSFRTYQDLVDALKSELSESEYSHIIHAAAVSDYSVARMIQGSFEVSGGKIPSGSPLTLELRPNPKIISQLKPWSRNKSLKVFGFKLTSQLNPQATREKVQQLFAQSPCEYVVQNDQTGLDRTRNQHPYQIFTPDLRVIHRGETRADLVRDVVHLVLSSSITSNPAWLEGL